MLQFINHRSFYRSIMSPSCLSTAFRNISTTTSRCHNNINIPIQQSPVGVSQITAQELDFKRLKIDMRIGRPTQLPALETLQFGKTFSDHMLEVDWDASTGWKDPIIRPFSNITVHPACSALHYGLEVFEGLKAFYQPLTDNIVLFRPQFNMTRLGKSCARIGLPQFDEDALLDLITQLVRVDSSFVPREEGYSLYIRPVVFSTQPSLGVLPPTSAKLLVMCSPVGPYFAEGFKPVKILADKRYVRAWPGGAGETKAGGNYGATVMPQRDAMEMGCSQILWLFPDGADDYFITEAGTMNVFIHWKNKEGDDELTTYPLSDNLILPGGVRDSVLTIAHGSRKFKVSEKKTRMKADLLPAVKDNRVYEIFGTGTACMVAPFKAIVFEDQEYEIPLGKNNAGSALGIGPVGEFFLNSIQDIQHGKCAPHPWCVEVGNDAAEKRLTSDKSAVAIQL